MSVHTPITRLTTFLSNNPRRISAPPPTPKSSKSRTALLSDTPPKCRRRLSFADQPDISLPPAPPSALLELAAELSKPHSPSIWSRIATELPSATWTAHLFTTPLIAALSNPESARFAAPVVPYVLANCSSQALVSAVLDSLIRHANFHNVFDKLANVLIDDDWGRVYAPALATRAHIIVPACIAALEAPQLDPSPWAAYLAVISITCEAVRRMRDAGQEIDFRFSREEAGEILTSFERIAPLSAQATEKALQSIKELFHSREIVSHFAVENAAAVFAEISRMYACRERVVRDVVHLLTMLASPAVLYYLT